MASRGFVEYVTSTSLRLFGSRIPHLRVFKENYLKSGISLTYESYMAVMFFACVITFVLAFVVGLVIHSYFFMVPLYQSIIAVAVLAVVSVLLVLVLFITQPLLRLRKRKAEIDSNLVYTAGYMGVLSAGGISVERAFSRVVEVEPRLAIRELAARFVSNVRMFGLDVASSLEDVKVHSPSDVFSKLLTGVINILGTSGDLKNLLLFETSRLLTLKREQLKKTLSALIALAELYVTAMVMAPITFIIMLTILSVLGTSQFGLSSATQLNLIVFFGLPVICTVFIVVLDGILPKDD